MDHRKRRCEERKELERLIWNCVRALSYYSISASQLARSKGPLMRGDFDLVHSEFRAASSRLKVLRECLGVHIKCHECADSASRSEMAAMYPFTNSDDSQRRIPVQGLVREGRSEEDLLALKIEAA